MADLTFKLGDLYDGYSYQTTRESTLPSGAEAEKTTTNNSEAKAEAVSEVTTSNASKKGILLGVLAVVGIGLILGAAR